MEQVPISIEFEARSNQIHADKCPKLDRGLFLNCSRRSGSIRLEDPWAPDMEAVKEGDESECDAIFEINSPDLPPSSYRPSMSPLHEHSASISLTEVKDLPVSIA